MPRLPDLQDLGQRPTPQAPAGVAQISSDRGLLMVPGQVMQRAAGQFESVAHEIEREKDRIDTARAEDAFTQLRQTAIDLSDGEDGYSRKRGGDAVKTPLLKDYGERFTKATQQIADGLGNDEQKRAFQRRAELARTQFSAGVVQHLMRENDTYQKQVLESTVDIESRDAWLTAQRGGSVGASLERVRAAVAREADRLGWDSKVAEDAQAKAASRVHLAVIDQALSAGNAQFARDYFDAYKDGMSREALAAAEKAIKPVTEFEAGKGLGVEAWAMRQAGKTATEVESFLAQKSKTREQYSIAQSIMTQHEQAQKAQDAQQRGSILETFSTAPNRATMNAIRGSREFLAMEPEARGQLVEYMRHQVQAAEDHGRVLSDRAEAKARQRWDENPEALATFVSLVDSPELSNMNSAAVYSYAPIIGPQLTAKLEAERRRRAAGAAQFQIDKDLLNEAIPKDLFRTENKAKLNAFKGLVETNLMDWKAAHPGKVPTAEDQKAIARSANADYVALGAGWFGSDKTVKAFELKPDMKAVPKDFVTGLRERAKVRGVALTDQQVLDAWAMQKGAR